ncbi:MAG: hypothetical protein II998_08635 [Clostridia bacterium]|nr:hypothetical protein [Clostridia bacterium]
MLSFCQQKIASYFENSIKNNTLRHAYILKGPHGVGKKHISRQIELYFSCSDGTGCGICDGCKTTLAGANFDIIRLSPNEKNRYEIKTIRELIKKLHEKPAGGSYKLVTIESAQLLEPACQNALLKIIEEPPYYVVFVLLCDNVNNILPTILSRVMMLELLPWTKEELCNAFPLTASDSFIYNCCMGNPGVLKSICADDGFKIARNIAVKALINVSRSADGVYEAVDDFVSHKERMGAMFDAMTLLARDVLYHKNNLASQIVNTDKQNEIKELSDTLTLSQTLKIVQFCGTMNANLKNNENVNMQILTLFMKLSALFGR